MSGNTFGTIFRVSTFGESHGEALGAVIDGCPAGIPITVEDIQYELNRRKPAALFTAEDGTEVINPAVTSRVEKDEVRILSGVFEGITLGTPIALEIKNTGARSSDYEKTADTFRPGHADYTWHKKYGVRDYRGGGRSSGRETAARVAAGAVARTVLKAGGNIDINAYTVQAAGINCPADVLPPVKPLDKKKLEQNPLKVPDAKTAQKMLERIEELRKKGDSAGGIIECRIEGVPAGWGEPVFDKLDAEIAKAVLSIGAVKGIEFGSGFACSAMTGSEWNDAMRIEKQNAGAAASDRVRFETNNAGGILGGISDGNTIVFRAAVKPVPSIFVPQKTVKAVTTGAMYENTELVIEGRHDVCLCPRIIPVIEAMTAICLTDMYLRNKSAHIKRLF
ncbi:chorismate synthase [Treponema sp. HNW]|uniref:chorismate synthase n=1 Tax=Treponema sp. HNW TaxID=3116654 RepID=UPI003D0DA9EF